MVKRMADAAKKHFEASLDRKMEDRKHKVYKYTMKSYSLRRQQFFSEGICEVIQFDTNTEKGKQKEGYV